MTLPIAKKSLGQHWLNDETVLNNIVESANIDANTVVLEIGPGLGSLTKILASKAKKVVAVELDDNLAKNLSNKVKADNLEVYNQNIFKFNLNDLPQNYILVANIPYYITNHLMRLISESESPPIKAVILVQKEVAQRICAKPGAMSLLSVSTQYYFDVSLGIIVKSELFIPPPKVDSQVVILNRKKHLPLSKTQEKDLFKLVKAGFSERRKKLRSSLSGGLGISKGEAEELLNRAGINPNSRAQELSVDDWLQLRGQNY